ncbi:hypothetical protein [Umezawaea sp. Da 62-37]|uniref:hypothetical protein n=1 Tax=Umezawaea sp. Da 62-37 TaxID=3075927 RepID=UPI0028F6F874|nr:hypothetical protein [Umezawaea sp. Da 62-37]WNV84324.1 hypothetical protein RM788_40165 [Umezawaea sp. Da 62-37]
MNTELVTRTGTLPADLITAAHSTEALELAVEQVLAAVRPAVLTDPVSGALRAEESLRMALSGADRGTDGPLRQAMACAEAACEHLRYCELQEARLLLVAARGQLVRAHAQRS